MMSCMHQMMSQWNQLVETTPAQSWKLFKTPETVNLTEKNEYSHQRHIRQHNDTNNTSVGSLLGLPVQVSNGIAVQEKHNTTIKLNNNRFKGHPNWLFGMSCMGNRT